MRPPGCWCRTTPMRVRSASTPSAWRRAGMAAIVMSALRPMMAYHGTRGAAVSTNPIAIAMPGGIMLDMSTSASSRGKLAVAKATGKPLPSGIALDKDGRPTTDPERSRDADADGRAEGCGPIADDRGADQRGARQSTDCTRLNDRKLMTRCRQNSLIVAMDVERAGRRGGPASRTSLRWRSPSRRSRAPKASTKS